MVGSDILSRSESPTDSQAREKSTMVTATWVNLGDKVNKKWGLLVPVGKAKTDDQVMATNRHGASQVKVLGAMTTITKEVTGQNQDGTVWVNQMVAFEIKA